MTFQHLRYLLAVHENSLNVTAAAREVLASHLPRRLVRAAEKAQTQDEVDRLFAGFTIPLRDNQ